MNYKSIILKKNNCKSSIIGVIGLGYVGMPLSLSFSKSGIKVIGFDIDKKKLNKLIKKKVIFGQFLLKILVKRYQKVLRQLMIFQK